MLLASLGQSAGMDPTTWGLIIGFGLLFVIVFLLVLWKNFLFICPPNEVLIFSGRNRKMPDGTVRGFRVIFGGRGTKWPVVEKVDRMSLNVMEVPINIRNAYSKGGIPLNVDAIANIKISNDPIKVGNAIERFLGRDMAEVKRVAKETMEGHLRGVLARLTPEEVNEDRLKFAEELSHESELDLSKLGIHLDTFKVTHVADDVHYLDSIGREMIANVIRDAEVAESDFKREAALAEASNQARGNVTQANVEANLARLRNDLRKIQADLESQVKSEEERTLAAAREANATAEQELQQIRSELEGIRLQADTVLPAEAQQVAQEFKARGDAAILRERGNASGQSLQLMNKAWQEAGPNAATIYVIEELEKLLSKAAVGVSKVKINNLSMIDSGDGHTLSSYVAAYPAMLGSVLDAVAATTGIDVCKVITTAPEEVPAKKKGEGKA